MTNLQNREDMPDLGKFKLLVQQSFGILNLPIAMITNAAVVIGFFGWEVALFVMCCIAIMFATLMYILSKFMFAQEVNYSWSKAEEWQEFRKEWKAFFKTKKVK